MQYIYEQLQGAIILRGFRTALQYIRRMSDLTCHEHKKKPIAMVLDLLFDLHATSMVYMCIQGETDSLDAVYI